MKSYQEVGKMMVILFVLSFVRRILLCVFSIVFQASCFEFLQIENIFKILCFYYHEL